MERDGMGWDGESKRIASHRRLASAPRPGHVELRHSHALLQYTKNSYASASAFTRTRSALLCSAVLCSARLRFRSFVHFSLLSSTALYSTLLSTSLLSHSEFASFRVLESSPFRSIPRPRPSRRQSRGSRRAAPRRAAPAAYAFSTICVMFECMYSTVCARACVYNVHVRVHAHVSGAQASHLSREAQRSSSGAAFSNMSEEKSRVEKRREKKSREEKRSRGERNRRERGKRRDAT